LSIVFSATVLQNCCTIDYNFSVPVNAPTGFELGHVEASTGERSYPIDYTILAGLRCSYSHMQKQFLVCFMIVIY